MDLSSNGDQVELDRFVAWPCSANTRAEATVDHMTAAPLRILVISNLYPPHHIGGYEIRCHEVVEGLKSRGHKLRVLTSTFGVTSKNCDGEVFRWLRHDFSEGSARHSSWVRAAFIIRNEWQNQRCLGRVLREFRPDVVFLWNPKHISMSLIPVTRAAGVPICFSIDDDWLARFKPDKDPWFRLWIRHGRNWPERMAKRLLRWSFTRAGLQSEYGPEDYHHALFVSHYMKNAALRAGRPVSDAEIIHGAVDTSAFRHRPRPGPPAPSRRLLYVGRLVYEKGVHDAIEALHVLRNIYGYRAISLSIVGSGDPAYDAQLQDLTRARSLETAVRFLGSVARDRMPVVYQEHHILLFPSLCPEGLPRAMLEAMSAGLVVVGTATGGGGEVLQHDTNSLIFPPGDALACATQVRRLLESPSLFEMIRIHARRTVEERFGMEVMLNHTEEALMCVAREDPVIGARSRTERKADASLAGDDWRSRGCGPARTNVGRRP